MFDNILSLRMIKNADDDLVVSAMNSAEAEVMEFRVPQVSTSIDDILMQLGLLTSTWLTIEYVLLC